MIINNPQTLQQLQANLNNMTEEDIKKVQIHIEGRLVFPNLITARPPKDNPEGRKTFNAVMIFPMGALSPLNNVGMNAIHTITERFKSMFHPQVPKHNYIRCYKNIQEHPTQDNGNAHPEFYQGSHWVNVSSGEKFKPKVYKKINGQLTEVESNDPDLYMGQNVIFVVSLYAYGTDPKKTTTRKGTGANLVGILIVGNGEKIGGGNQVDFDPNASFNAFASMTADFSSGSTNPFAGAGQPNQGQNQASSNPFGGGQQNQQSNNFGQNYGQQDQGQASNPFAQPNNGQNNNGNNGGNPFGGGLI